MKITPEQLVALQNQQKNIARQDSGTGFAQALQQELTTTTPDTIHASPLSGTPAAGLDQILRATMLNNPREHEVMNRMDSLLSQWEKYSQALENTPDGNLRKGYDLLADIRQNIHQVKEELTANPGLGQGLQAMLEELDILSITEEFKFNRGDYLN